MKHLLQDAAAEIRALRRQNEILRAKVDVMELFSVVLHTKPNYPDQACSVDVAWQCEKKAAELAKIESENALGVAVAPATQPVTP